MIDKLTNSEIRSELYAIQDTIKDIEASISDVQWVIQFILSNMEE